MITECGGSVRYGGRAMFIKVCGITNEDDALLAVALGADAIGFVFAAGSRRMVMPATVADIVKRLPHDTVTVGVFRNERPERVAEIVNTTGLRGAQLHGREPLSEVRWVRQRVPFVIQAFPAGRPDPLDRGERPGRRRADRQPRARLGPGLRLVAHRGRAGRHPAAARRRAEPGQRRRRDREGPALGRRREHRVEATAGRKDPRKLKRFIDAARAAGELLVEENRPPVPTGSSPYDWMDDE